METFTALRLQLLGSMFRVRRLRYFFSASVIFPTTDALSLPPLFLFFLFLLGPVRPVINRVACKPEPAAALLRAR